MKFTFLLVTVFKLQLMQSWILALQYSCKLRWFLFSFFFFKHLEAVLLRAVLDMLCFSFIWFLFSLSFCTWWWLLAFWHFPIIGSLNDSAKTGSGALFWCSPGVFLIPFKPECRLKHHSEPTWLGLMPVGLFPLWSTVCQVPEALPALRALRKGHGM